MVDGSTAKSACVDASDYSYTSSQTRLPPSTAPLELFEPGLGDVDGMVLPVGPPLEVVVDADASVGQRLAVFMFYNMAKNTA